jgi:hypothetical protein
MSGLSLYALVLMLNYLNEAVLLGFVVRVERSGTRGKVIPSRKAPHSASSMRAYGLRAVLFYAN